MYRIIILPVVLYESLTLREEYKLRPLENRFLRAMFSSTGMEFTRALIKLQNKEFHDFYSPNIIRILKSRRMQWERTN